jgi:hypothetical protein
LLSGTGPKATTDARVPIATGRMWWWHHCGA